MSQTEEAKTELPLDEVRALAARVLEHCGYASAHADAISDMLYRCQLDDCQSHGLFRLFMCATTMKDGKIDGAATPVIDSLPTPQSSAPTLAMRCRCWPCGTRCLS